MPAPDEEIWYDTVDRTIHRPVRWLNGTTGPDHTRGHQGVPMLRYDAMHPDTTTLCEECYPKEESP